MQNRLSPAGWPTDNRRTKAGAYGAVLISSSPEVITLRPGDGAVIPVQKVGEVPEVEVRGLGYHHVVMPSNSSPLDPATGAWTMDQDAGVVMITNPTEVDIDIELGAAVATVQGLSLIHI